MHILLRKYNALLLLELHLFLDLYWVSINLSFIVCLFTEEQHTLFFSTQFYFRKRDRIKIQIIHILKLCWWINNKRRLYSCDFSMTRLFSYSSSSKYCYIWVNYQQIFRKLFIWSWCWAIFGKVRDIRVDIA